MRTGSMVSGGLGGGCCDPLDVWGIHVNAPNFWELDDNFNASIVGGMDTYALLEPGRTGTFGQPVTQTIKPEPWDRDVHSTAGWRFTAVKLPSSYPYSCNPSAAHHSGQVDEGGDGTWQVDLGLCAEHNRVEVGPTPDEVTNSIPHWRFCFGSRAIYVDGVQTYIAYRLSNKLINSAAVQNHGYGTEIGEIVVCDIAAQTGEIYAVQRSSPPSSLTAMETALYENMAADFDASAVIEGLGSLNKQIAAQAVGIGKDYCVFSSYKPGLTSWTVGRAKFDGTRLGNPGIEVRYSPNDVGTAEEGEWKVVLPAVRTYIDSSADTPDEPYVLVVNSANTAIRTCKWQSDVYRSGYSGDPEENALIDGTVHDDEAAAGNLIIDTSDSGDPAVVEFPGETWGSLRIRCYNRVYDPTTGHSTDLVLFTTDSTPITASAWTADFEGDVQHNMPAEVQFENGGTQTFDYWELDTGTYHGGASSITTHWQDVTKQAVVELAATITLETASDLTFWYIHDNRWYGHHEEPWVTLLNQADPDNYFDFKVDGVILNSTDNPEFNLLVDDGGGDVTLPSTRIDNVNSPDMWDGTEEFFLTWRKVTVTLPVGTHRLTWTTTMHYQNNGHLHTWLDDISFPDCLTGDDANGVRRWFYANGKVRRCKYWTWAKVDDENGTVPVSRISTVPDFIAMDWEGRILIGNPHYLARVLIDESNDDAIDETFGSYRYTTGGAGEGGYVRWTASPNITLPDNPCWDLDNGKTATPDTPDTVPGWGCFQVLPVTGAQNYQVRGVYGAIRDATTDPLGLDQFTFPHAVNGGNFDAEQFFYLTKSYSSWSQRPSCWTISEDGTELKPHLEIFWRPTKNQPSWPESPDGSGHWPSPPYMSTFDTAEFGGTNGSVVYTDMGMARIYDPLQLPESSEKTRWTPMSYVISRGYSTTFTQSPHVLWCSIDDAPPDDPEDPAWYDPDLYGPWLPAKWVLRQARFEPCGLRFAWPQLIAGTHYDETCPDPENPEVTYYAQVWVVMESTETDPMGIKDFWPYTDFDVVDSGGTCECLG